MSKVKTIVKIAQICAEETPGFFAIKGPGDGDRSTNAFMKDLRVRIKNALGADYAEQKICGENNLAVDFYIPNEETIVEIALGLRNPGSEFEKDTIKAIMAQESGYSVKKIIFISKPGATRRHSYPSSRAIMSWIKSRHGIDIEIHELCPGK